MTKTGKILTAIGLLLLAAALCLTVYNLRSDTAARRSADAVLAQLTPELEEREAEAEAGASAPSAPGEAPAAAEETFLPDYLLDPEMEMPSEEIDSRSYIGVLRLPSLGLELPVLGEWSDSGSRAAPCRYSGSAYLDNMVIAGHNYSGHFGTLKNLAPGDALSFTDMDGNVFSYTVVELETLPPYAVEEMTSGDWDLTLFTCTVGGQSRLAVRCERAEAAA